MSSADYKNRLTQITRQLLLLHRGLLNFQKGVQEVREGKPMSPQELLTALLQNSDYAWMRKLSGLITRIDERVDDKKNPNLDDYYPVALKEIQDLFAGRSGNEDFKNRFEATLAQDPELRLQWNQLKHEIIQH